MKSINTMARSVILLIVWICIPTNGIKAMESAEPPSLAALMDSHEDLSENALERWFDKYIKYSHSKKMPSFLEKPSCCPSCNDVFFTILGKCFPCCFNRTLTIELDDEQAYSFLADPSVNPKK